MGVWVGPSVPPAPSQDPAGDLCGDMSLVLLTPSVLERRWFYLFIYYRLHTAHSDIGLAVQLTNYSQCRPGVKRTGENGDTVLLAEKSEFEVIYIVIMRGRLIS